MSEKNSNTQKSYSLDWLVQGVLTKLGETFDGLTGRKWKPSSSLATSELIERLKLLLDAEVRDTGGKGKFVPHNLKLKMQWDKFSTDSTEVLKKLESELLTAAIDHINDRRYHTYAPLKLEVKPDYFTEGVKLYASFDTFAEKDREAEMNVTLPDMKSGDLIPGKIAMADNGTEIFIAHFTANDVPKNVKLRFQNNQRLSVGRTRENDLAIEDASVSKVHASLVLNAENNLMIADTGSTNGTFINGERISYGKAMSVGNDDKVSFGTVDVSFEYVPKPVEIRNENDLPVENSVTINGFEFKSRVDSAVDSTGEPESDITNNNNKNKNEIESDLMQKTLKIK